MVGESIGVLTHPLPEIGQLVEVRQRRFVVTDIARSTLLRDALLANNGPPHHLVSLSSVEDDGYGEELQVIWEIEPNARAFDAMAMPAPEDFDPPHRLDTFLNAVRWGAVTSADVQTLQAPFRSGIDIEDYQLDPLVRALQMPRVNLLIADDVGLGKTIEAGLVLQELILRHRVRTVLIVCPAALQIQWQEQMRDKFGLEFRIVNSELMKRLRREQGIHVNPWRHYPRLITSIDYLKRDRPMRLFRELLPPDGRPTYPRKFDMLIVDEAHNVAPSGRGKYAVDSLRTKAIRTIAPHFEHKLFLTATPHNGYVESFSALLELLDDQRFARGIPPDKKALQQVMVRRLKSELPPRWDGSPRFPRRELQVIEVAYSEEERHAHALLQRYTHLRAARAGQDPMARTATNFVLKLLKKRLFSSPAAFLHTLEQHRQTLEALAAGPTETPVPAKPVRLRYLQELIDAIETGDGEEQLDSEEMQEALRATARTMPPLTPEESKILDELHAWASRAAGRADSKARKLLDWLEEHIRPEGQWSHDRVIIFTEYRDTQNWLFRLLAGRGMTEGDRTLKLFGGMREEERERVKAAFQASPEISPVRILLATDAASEGIDLQLHCHQLIHYEIPWNPNRLEQRNGRIDRHGQRRNPQIYHFAPATYRALKDGRPSEGSLEWDLEFLALAIRKVEQIRNDLGSVGPVIAEQVSEAMLGQRRVLNPDEAVRAREPARAMLKFEQDLNARIEKLRQKLLETRDILQLTPEHVRDAVQLGLELAGQPRLRETQIPGLWPDPSGRIKACPVFEVPPLRGSWQYSLVGLEHPYTGKRRPLVFDADLARGRDDVVLAHLNYPLVQRALRLLRAEVWRSGGAGRLHRVTARLIPGHLADTPIVVAHARLVMTGALGHRLHEEVLEVGGEIREGRFSRIRSVSKVRALLRAAGDELPPPDILARLQAVWPNIEPSLQRTLEVRGQERTDSLRKKLAARAQKEAGDIEAILLELKRTIERELNHPEPVQLSLFSPTEREQYSRNQNALRARLQKIPKEIEQETEAIRRRYADPEPRLFPVAITFLVPSSR